MKFISTAIALFIWAQIPSQETLREFQLNKEYTGDIAGCFQLEDADDLVKLDAAGQSMDALWNQKSNEKKCGFFDNVKWRILGMYDSYEVPPDNMVIYLLVVEVQLEGKWVTVFVASENKPVKE